MNASTPPQAFAWLAFVMQERPAEEWLHRKEIGGHGGSEDLSRDAAAGPGKADIAGRHGCYSFETPLMRFERKKIVRAHRNEL